MRTIWLVPADISPRRALRHFGPKNIKEWVFLGKSYTLCKTWENHLGTEHQIRLEQSLNKKAWELRHQYADWIGELGRPYGDSMLWWTTDLCEKNTASSDLFLNLCYLEIVEEIVEDGSTPLLCLVEDWTLLLSLRSMLDEKKTPYGRVSSTKWLWVKNSATEWGLFIVRSLYHLSKLARQFIAARRTKYLEPPFVADPGRKRVLILTCIDESCLGKDSSFRDRYFTALPNWLKDNGFDLVTMVWPFNLKRPLTAAFEWFRKNREFFLIPEDYLKIRDYPGAISVVLKQLKIPAGKISFKGKDCHFLLLRERLRQAASLSKVRYILYAKVIQRLKAKGWRLDYFVNTFENMWVEKPIAKALHIHYPSTIHLGFQHATINPFMLKYMTGADEAVRSPQVFPDYIVCNGTCFRDILARNGFPRERLRLGPALRYLYLSEKENGNTHKTKDKIILLTLPLTRDIAQEVFEKSVQAFQGLPAKVAVKAHPMMDAESLLETAGYANLPEFMIWAKGEMKSWLPRAVCVIGTATAAVFEAVMAGIPVVVMGQEGGLELNPLAWWQDEIPMFKALYKPEQIRDAAKYWINVTGTDKKIREIEQAQSVLSGCFNPWQDSLLKDIFFENARN